MAIKRVMAMIGALLIFCNTAHATLIGDTINVEWENQNIIQQSHMVVVSDPGVELGFPNFLSFEVDVSASTISLTFLGDTGTFGSPSDHFIFSDLDWVGMPNGIITGLNLMQTGINGLSVTFTDHSVSLDVTGSTWIRGDSVLITLATNHVVPESSTLALFCFALTGLGFVRYRKLKLELFPK